jgi:dTDP-4-dehydrorhamnose reductase
MNNILVTGADGQLGSEIKKISEKFSDYHFIFTNKSTLNIYEKKKLCSFIEENKIKGIINCAAYTNVDKAESDAELCEKVNSIAPQYLAEVAKLYKCKFIHISTDYVFDGNSFKPYITDDTPNPQSKYGETKLLGELAINKVNPENSIIIRTSWVYSSFGNNFVKTMLRLEKERDELNIIYDQIGTPTFAGDLAEAILEILPKINNKHVEVFHYSNEGVSSWYDFAAAIFELSDSKCKVKPIKSSQFPTIAKRPLYSVLDKTKIKETYQINIPYWRESLKKCLKILKDK